MSCSLPITHLNKVIVFNMDRIQGAALAVLQYLEGCHVDRKVEELSVTGEHTAQWMEVSREADISSVKGFQARTHI